MQTQALPGFREFYPADLSLRSHIFQTWRAVAARYGFEEYDGPPLEPLELYTTKSGAEIVGQLYEFEDKGKRRVALRPEMTPTLARMVSARANGLRKPIRWFSIPQLFRYERQQRGRLREHFQLNCDLIGEPGPGGDAEIVALAIDVMRAFGFGPGDVRVRISDRRVLAGVLAALGLSGELETMAHQALDKLGRREYGAARQALVDGGAAAASVGELESLAAIKDLPALNRRFGQVDTTSLSTLTAALDAMGLAGFLDLDLTIVRGLAYYTGTVFEVFDAQKSLRAICGGGRYDDLLRSIGGTDLPALGFGMGDVVLGELLREHSLAREPAGALDVFVAWVTGEDLAFALGLAHELRDAGLSVEYTFTDQPLRKQLELANARRARSAVVIGPDERVNGEVVLRNLEAKTQEAVPRDRVVDLVSRGRQD